MKRIREVVKGLKNHRVIDKIKNIIKEGDSQTRIVSREILRLRDPVQQIERIPFKTRAPFKAIAISLLTKAIQTHQRAGRGIQGIIRSLGAIIATGTKTIAGEMTTSKDSIPHPEGMGVIITEAGQRKRLTI